MSSPAAGGGRGRSPLSRAAAAGILLSLAGAAAVCVAGPGTRLSLWDFREGFAVLRYGALLAAAGSLLSAVAVHLCAPGTGRRGLALALAGFALGAAAFAVPAGRYRLARTLPAIHDITTDTEDPPAFVAALPLRRDAPNPSAYGGSGIAEMQRDAYPDLRPILLDVPPSAAFDRALDAARGLGWDVVSAVPGEGRIEAVAVTPWFGFRDDVVVRIRPDGAGGSRVDVRSVSRVGRGDAGENARRIRSFAAAVAPPGGVRPSPPR